MSWFIQDVASSSYKSLFVAVSRSQGGSDRILVEVGVRIPELRLESKAYLPDRAIRSSHGDWITGPESLLAVLTIPACHEEAKLWRRSLPNTEVFLKVKRDSCPPGTKVDEEENNL